MFARHPITKPWFLLLPVSAVTFVFLAVIISADDKDEGKDVSVLKDGQFEIPRADIKSISLINRESEFNAMMAEVVRKVEELARAQSQEELDNLVAKLADEYGEKAIECLIRFRTPLVIPVFARLVRHEKWYVRRLAIFGLQRNAGLSELDKIVESLKDENFLVREIAAMTVAILHNMPYHPKLVPKTKEQLTALKELSKRKKADLAALAEAMEKEANPYVRSAIEASINGMTKFKLLRVCDEVVGGSKTAPYIERGGNQSTSGKGKSGGSSKMAPSKNWCYPVCVYPKEIIMGNVQSDPPLVPLPEKGNSLHFGHDCGWFLEGSGVYAIADGQLRTVEYAGDFGVLIVGEYRVNAKEYVTALNGHCAMWVFAAPGPVKCRQLLGAIGLGFSAENGVVHAAHNHFGMFSGKYDRSKCFGRGAAGTSTKGWLVPAEFLGPKVEGKKIVPESYR